MKMFTVHKHVYMCIVSPINTLNSGEISPPFALSKIALVTVLSPSSSTSFLQPPYGFVLGL